MSNQDVSQPALPGCDLNRGNAILLRSKDAWIATRFGLCRNRRREPHLRKNWKPEHHRDEFKGWKDKIQLYELNVLPDMAALNRLVALMDEQEIPYEVM